MAAGDSAHDLPAPRLVPAQSVGYMLWLATLAWQRIVREALKPHGITQVQFGMLAAAWWLQDHGEESTQRRLATYMGIEEMMTSQVARRLESARLVQRRPAKSDARAIEVVLTPKGLEIFTEATEAMFRIEDEYFGILGDDRQALFEGLRELARSQHREPWELGAI